MRALSFVSDESILSVYSDLKRIRTRPFGQFQLVFAGS